MRIQRLLILFFAIGLMACAPDPVQQARADAIRLEAMQEAAQQAPPAPVFDPTPWLAVFCGGVVMTGLLVGVAFAALYSGLAQLRQATERAKNPHREIIQLGRGRYYLADESPIRLLDWDTPADRRLLESIDR